MLWHIKEGTGENALKEEEEEGICGRKSSICPSVRRRKPLVIAVTGDA